MKKDVEGVLDDAIAPRFTCKLCGSEDNFHEYDKCDTLNTMREHHVCYSCAYWMNKIAHPHPQQEIIGGHYYIIRPYAKRPLNVIKGFFGKEFYIRRLDGTLIKSNNVWHQGQIPEHFRDELPDTANFVTLMTFQKLKNDTHKCESVGCWDRYNCLRYRIELEKEGKPWNVVPPDHVPGSEHCPSFVNFTDLLT